MKEAYEIPIFTASDLYLSLPIDLQITTLDPIYVLADSYRDRSLKPTFIIYREHDRFWLLSCHKSHVPNSDLFKLSSPYGYGGPLANNKDQSFLYRATEAYKKWCQEAMILEESFALHPMVDHPYAGRIKTNRKTYTVGKEYSSGCMKAVKKAKSLKLVAVEYGSDKICSIFVNFYRKSMKEIGAKEFYLFNDSYFDALSKLPNTFLLGCEEDGEWRSMAVMLLGANVAEYHLSVTNEQGKKIGAANFLLDFINKQKPDEVTLYLGGGRTASADDSLAKFKSSFGGKHLDFKIGSYIHKKDAYRELTACGQ